MINFLILFGVLCLSAPAVFAEETMSQETKKAIGETRQVVNSELCSSSKAQCSYKKNDKKSDTKKLKTSKKLKKTTAPVPEDKDQVD